MSEYKAVAFTCKEEKAITFPAGFLYTALEGPDGKYYEIAPGTVLELDAAQVREYGTCEEDRG